METIDHQPSTGPPETVGRCDGDWTEAELRLRARIIEHYQWVSTFDRDYAVWGYRRSREAMPWLKL